MKRHILRGLIIGTIATCFVTGCYHRAYHQPVVTTSSAGEVIVTETPPPVRTEVITTAPSASHVWVPGYWTYRDKHWDWMEGHWEVRPRMGAQWVPGHWDQTYRGWVWTPGHWS